MIAMRNERRVTQVFTDQGRSCCPKREDARLPPSLPFPALAGASLGGRHVVRAPPVLPQCNASRPHRVTDGESQTTSYESGGGKLFYVVIFIRRKYDPSVAIGGPFHLKTSPSHLRTSIPRNAKRLTRINTRGEEVFLRAFVCLIASDSAAYTRPKFVKGNGFGSNNLALLFQKTNEKREHRKKGKKTNHKWNSFSAAKYP